VQNRGAEILGSLKASSALSCAGAIEKHLKDWLGLNFTSSSSVGDDNDNLNYFSMGIISDNNPYGIPPGLVFSFPCKRNINGSIEIVGGLPINSELRELLETTTKELEEERGVAIQFLQSS
jgi:malate/lactate dehydrogenase